MFAFRRQGKGFFVTLSLCLVAVATLTVYSLRDSLFATDTPSPSPSTTTTTTARPTEQAVVEPVTNVPDTRTTTTTAAQPLYVLPVSNTVGAVFSREPVYNQTMGDWRTHNGVDFKADIGTSVMAITDGTVLAIAEDTLWGALVRLDHGDFVATYAGVTAADTLKVGDTVKVGETIGTLTIVPAELLDGGHLHLEMMRGDTYVDPLDIIDREVKFK